MPCYTIQTISVEFKVGNIELLKKAIEKAGFRWEQDRNTISIGEKGWSVPISINLNNSLISSRTLSEKELTSFSNTLKRSYSEVIIGKVAMKQKWIAKKLSDRKFQLVKY